MAPAEKLDSTSANRAYQIASKVGGLEPGPLRPGPVNPMRRMISVAGVDGRLSEQTREKSMKRNHAVATLSVAASSTAARQRVVKPSSADNSSQEDQRALMTRGERTFSLRDVHRYWSTPRISDHEIEMLEQANLIQRAPTQLCAIRLTEHGASVKKCQQPKAP